MIRVLHDDGSARGILLVALALVTVLALVGAGFAAWVFGYVGGSSGEAVPVQVVVPRGSGSADVAQILAKHGVIASPLRFRIRARLADADGQMKAGSYELSTNMPDELVVARLVQGPRIKTVTFTIPEGFTAEQIAERVGKKTGIPAKEFAVLAMTGADGFASAHPYLAESPNGSLEGFLFPKTYTVRERATAREITEMMLDQFDKEYARVDVSGAEGRGMDTYELVTIASMIEREAAVAKDRPLVSSVIHNRLRRSMRLQVCSTVEYVLKTNKRRLSASDTMIVSPYNTYRHEGLPPTPISNPGLASLKAAADPADTDYIYYVLTGKDGSHTFARTDAEFLAAKRRSKEVFGE